MTDNLRKLAGMFVQLDETEPTKGSADVSKTGGSDISTLLGKAPIATTPGGGGGGGDAWAQFEAEAAKRGATTVSSIVAGQPGPNLDTIQVPIPAVDGSATHAEAAVPIKLADGSYDFSPVYVQAGIIPPAFPAEKALEMIKSYPKELPIAIQRSTTKIALSAMPGVTPDSIVGDAAIKMAALQKYGEGMSKQYDSWISDSDTKIAGLQEQIKRFENIKLQAAAKKAETIQACKDASAHLDDVVEFFTLDAGASKLATPTT
jgi:hypothetical protein